MGQALLQNFLLRKISSVFFFSHIIQINGSQISLFVSFFQSFGRVSFCEGGAAIDMDEGLSKNARDKGKQMYILLVEKAINVRQINFNIR